LCEEEMIRTNLLYSTVIENDGRIGKEPTVLGAALFIIIFTAVAFFIVPSLVAFL